jgi:exopolysaccharide biosynthesis protein
MLGLTLCLTATAQELPTTTAGQQIILNGHAFTGAWLQQAYSHQVSTYLSDSIVRQFGIDLLDSSTSGKQPVQWFSSATLDAKVLGGYRYLDMTNLAQTEGWQIQSQGQTLAISTPTAKVTNMIQDVKSIVINLDRPTPWQLNTVSGEWRLTLDGVVNTYTPQPLIKQIEVVNNQTIIHLNISPKQAVKINSLPSPNRLILTLQPDTVVERDIAWTQGISWRQHHITLGKDSFPVVWLEVNPLTIGLTLKPMWTNPQTLVGTAPLSQTAQSYLALAAINGGYFNRHTQLPLGAIRRDDQWVSSPILNRGAIAWNDAGEFYFGRLTLRETLISQNNQPLPILFLNSGYVKNGISRYTPLWGSTYTPLSDHEVLLVVEQNQITQQLSGGKAAVPIPPDGYILTLRGDAVSMAAKLPIGTPVNISTATVPADFSHYSNIVGAGPLLLKDRQIVLDPQTENFHTAFSEEKAVRSGICTTATGSLLIVTVGNRIGGLGPTLAEHAQLMGAIGCVNALNLDGGSSTSLYLGGQLINRSPGTAARVHNGIGIFINN